MKRWMSFTQVLPPSHGFSDFFESLSPFFQKDPYGAIGASSAWEFDQMRNPGFLERDFTEDLPRGFNMSSGKQNYSNIL